MANRVPTADLATHFITYDNGYQVDYYDGDPGEFEIRTAQRAAPYGVTTVGRIVGGWREVETECRPPLDRPAGGAE